MPDVVFPQGTTVEMATQATGGTWGTATPLPNLRSLNGNTRTMSFSDTTSLSDNRIRRRPARMDYGTLSMEFALVDDPTATNQLKTLRDALEARQRHKLTVKLPGTFDDTTPLIEYEGFFSSVSTPDVRIDDNLMSYSVTFQVD